MSSLLGTLRLAARALRRAPAFTAAAVLTLALGIGATAAIFSVVNGVLLRPLPYAQPERLVGVWFAFPGLGVPQASMSDGTYFLYRRENRVFEDMGASAEGAVNLTTDQAAERVSAAWVTASLLPTLRVPPLHGRLITADEDHPGRPRVALIGEGMWRRRFGADPRVLGRTIRIDGVSHEIVGVLPGSFHYPSPATELWLPLALDPAHAGVGGFNYNTVARLKPGVTAAAAGADLARLLRRISELYPEVGPGLSTSAMLEKGRTRAYAHPLRDDVVGDVGRVLWVILGTVGFVLLVACANVANLFLVRAEARQRELALRTAIGGGRGEVVRQLLGEGVVLAAVGGAVGLALAFAGLRLLVRLGGGVPRIHEVGMDGATLAVTAGVTLLVALLCSLLPIVRYAARDLSPLLREGGRASTQGRERQRARQLLVVAQVALALVLLAASGLMARSFWTLRTTRAGFEPSHALTFRMSLPEASYADDGAVARFYEQAAARVAALPGVRAVGAVTKVPLLSEGDNHSVVWVEGVHDREGALPPVDLLASATSDYFRAAGIPVVAGRTFAPLAGDRRVTEVVVSASFARHWFGDATGRAALGRRLRRSPQGGWYTIVGVVGDVRDAALEKPPEEMIYFPVVGHPGQWEYTPRTMSLVVRTAGEPTAVAAAAQREVRALDAGLPVFNLRTLAEIVRGSMARTSFTMLLLGTASAVALLLGVVGIYGVVAYAVSLRTREIGVRIALGARPGDVSRMVTRQGTVLAVIGVAAGLAGAAALTRFLTALLHGVSPTDPLTLGGAALTLLASALVASWLPARRAARVDPTTALRAD
jgi:putative ABC transport system permease protein